MTEPTTTDSIDLDKLAQKLDAILQGYDVHNDALALIERLRTAEARLAAAEQRTACKCDPPGSGEEYCTGHCYLQAEVERLSAGWRNELALLAAAEVERDELEHQAMNLGTVAEWEKRNRQLVDERDELKESLRTTRLEQAAKAFQVDELETKVLTLTAERDQLKRVKIGRTDTALENANLREQVERLTAEHEKDRQAWMAENTELLTQVDRLTEELDYWKSEAALEKGG